MTFAVGMSRQPLEQSRVPRNVAAVGVSGIEPAFRVSPPSRTRTGPSWHQGGVSCVCQDIRRASETGTPTDHTRRRHDAAHAQTYANQQMPQDSAIPPHLPPGHACQRIHHLTERFRQYLWLGNARQTDKPLPPRPHYPRPHIRSGAARSTGTAPDRLKRPWIWE